MWTSLGSVIANRGQATSLVRNARKENSMNNHHLNKIQAALEDAINEVATNFARREFQRNELHPAGRSYPWRKAVSRRSCMMPVYLFLPQHSLCVGSYQAYKKSSLKSLTSGVAVLPFRCCTVKGAIPLVNYAGF